LFSVHQISFVLAEEIVWRGSCQDVVHMHHSILQSKRKIQYLQQFTCTELRAQSECFLLGGYMLCYSNSLTTAGLAETDVDSKRYIHIILERGSIGHHVAVGLQCIQVWFPPY
jgi:hypothetical protein